MIVCVDIGNSNAVIGLFDQGWKHTWRISTRSDSAHGFKLEITQRWIETGYHTDDITRVWISSVVPDLTEAYRLFAEGLFNVRAFIIGPQIYERLGLQMGRPDEIGTDLVANAFAVKRLYKRDALIVDFGTALTFLAMTGSGEILGASIVPGIEMALKTLNQSTAKLPIIDFGIPSQVAGRSTREAIQSGIIIGYEGLTRHLIQSYRNWYEKPLYTVATGGLVNVLTQYHQMFDTIHPTLTLDGIREIADVMTE
jgi:type III pantothenate kinase